MVVCQHPNLQLEFETDFLVSDLGSFECLYRRAVS